MTSTQFPFFTKISGGLWVGILIVMATLLLEVGFAAAEVPEPARTVDAKQAGEEESESARALSFRQLIEQATQDYSAGRYDQAAEKYLVAYRLRHRPLLLFNIAQVYRKAGQTQNAVKYYENFLREDPQSELAAEVRNYIKALTAQGSPAATDERAAAARADNFVGTEEERLRLFRKYIDGAVASTKAGAFTTAAENYWAAYGLRPQNIIIFNVGQVYRKAGRWAEALSLFQRFLRDEPSSPLSGEAEAYIAESQARLSKREADANRQTAENLAKANAALAERLVEIREIDRKIYAQNSASIPKPIYRRPWFWVLIGTAAAGAALGIGLGVGLQPKLPVSDLGQSTLRF